MFLFGLNFQFNLNIVRDYIMRSKLLDKSYQIYLSRPLSTVWTIFSVTERILLIYQLGWKIYIHTI